MPLPGSPIPCEKTPRGSRGSPSGNNLFVFRPTAVRPILDGDPQFYRPNGEDDLAAIARVSEAFHERGFKNFSRSA